MDYLHFAGASISREDHAGQGGGGLCEVAVEGHHAEHGEAPRLSGPCRTTMERHGRGIVIRTTMGRSKEELGRESYEGVG